MRIAVVGTGGVGGTFGGLLAAKGEAEVVFVARGAHLAALQTQGLRLHTLQGSQQIASVQASDDPSRVGIVDAILFCVKTYHVPEVAPLLAPMIGPGTVIVPTQNGIETPQVLAALYGQRPVLGGVAYLSASVTAPGEVTLHGNRARLVFGELDGRPSARATALLAVLQAAGIDALLSQDIRSVMWQKFLFIVAMAGTTAAARCPLGPILTTPESRELFMGLMREVEALAAHADVVLPPDAVVQALRLADSVAPTTKSSMLVDLERGHPLEVDDLNGAVVRLGQRYNLPTPLNSTITAILKAATARQ
jgi:2-dehydropantoate 2-reductase